MFFDLEKFLDNVCAQTHRSGTGAELPKTASSHGFASVPQRAYHRCRRNGGTRHAAHQWHTGWLLLSCLRRCSATRSSACASMTTSSAWVHPRFHVLSFPCPVFISTLVFMMKSSAAADRWYRAQLSRLLQLCILMIPQGFAVLVRRFSLGFLLRCLLHGSIFIPGHFCLNFSCVKFRGMPTIFFV